MAAKPAKLRASTIGSHLTMKRTTLALTGLLLVCNISLAADVPVPPPPALKARSYILVDHDSGRALVENNADERLDPASITKLMTAYAVFHALKDGKLSLKDNITISEHAWKAEGSRTFVQVGTQVPIEVLIQGMIVQSGNDATIALAERVGGTEETFAALMNNYAKQLGMKGSHFVNSSGLPSPEHYMTARDMAILGSAIIREFPDYYKWYSQREFTWNKIRQENRNGLLGRDPSVDGMKTGHTETAGYCLVTSAKRDNMRLISVVLGTASMKAREDASQALLNYGYTFYETRKLHKAGESLQAARVWKAAFTPAQIGLRRDLYITAPRGQFSSLKTTIEVQPRLIAPLPAQKPVGTLTVSLREQVLDKRYVYPVRDVPQGGWWRRMVDSILLWLE
ncbi:MAG TPA: D-alanyl-D-alanine carboxypeptidase family protein [Steroidobacteraceae bacterium]|nr:D-alanyl-D-alanine carboxypeptidase family protein [Steroidobacteraceae bacterium]